MDRWREGLGRKVLLRDTPKMCLEKRPHQLVAGAQDLLEQGRLRLLEKEHKALEYQKVKERYE